MSRRNSPGSFRIFTDGASSGNPGPAGWAAIVAEEGGEVRELGGRAASATNNRMELTAAIEALEAIADRPGPVEVETDSTYLIQGITQWVRGWKRRGWTTTEGADVLNRDLWERLHALTEAPARKGRIRWTHVRGHSGHPANDRVDAIAVAFSKGLRPDLYQGAGEGYGVSLDRTGPPTATPKQKSKGPAYSYVSLLDGVALRHRTWEECERRVKGRAGAKYRKALSAQDEAAILASWGVSPAKL